MAESRHHGTVTTTEHPIPDDEPVFVIRAQDALSTQILDDYYLRAMRVGCDPDFLNDVQAARAEFAGWQDQHRDAVKVPDR